MTRLATICLLTALTSCADTGGGIDDDEIVFDDTKGDRAGTITTFKCDVKEGLGEVDDVASVEFKIKGFNTVDADFVEGEWKVLDKNGKALETDGERSSIIAAAFDNGGNDIEQCRKSGRKTTCGTFKILTSDINSEYGVTLYLTSGSEYAEGRLTIDRTISVGDYPYAPISCNHKAQ